MGKIQSSRGGSTMTGNLAIAAPAMACAGIVATAAFVCMLAGYAQKLQVSWKKTGGWVLTGIFLGAVFRLTWWVIEYVITLYTVTNPNDPIAIRYGRVNFVLQRLSWYFFGAAFLLLMYGWIASLHARRPPPSSGLVTAAKMVIMGSLVISTLYTLIVIVLFHTVCQSPNQPNGATCATVFDTEILWITFMLFFLSVGFLLYGATMMHWLKKDDKKFKPMWMKLIVVMMVAAFCYACRCIMFVYRPITQRQMPEWAFFCFGYILVDTVPPLLFCLVVLSTSKENRKALADRVGSQYIVLGEQPDDDDTDYLMANGDDNEEML